LILCVSFRCPQSMPLLRIIRLAKPAGKYIIGTMKITEEMKKEIRRQLASAGGRARAKRYDKKTLSKWAKKGGRPRTRKVKP
jgi:hypothetical protein